jgi:uncharacterized Zn finger protein
MNSRDLSSTPVQANKPLIDIEALLLAAGPQTFQKGFVLFQQSHVSNVKIKDNIATASVKGISTYQVKMTMQPELQCHCTCPAAEYMPVCKHAVAVALSLNGQPVDVEDETSDEQVLRRYFSEKSAEELIELLLQAIERDEQQWRSWLLKAKLSQSDISLAELKKMVTKALPARDIYNWNEVSRYFSVAEQQIDSLWEAMANLPVESQWQLTEHVLIRLNKVLERIDDSGGFRFGIEGQINEKMPELFERLSWPAEQKAKWLFDHLYQTEYDVFPDINEHFSISGDVETCLLAMCRNFLDEMASELTTGKERTDIAWRMRVYAKPLLKVAKAASNWREEEQLLAILAHQCRDYLALAQLCLDHHEELDAEDWLLRAKKIASAYEQQSCVKMDIRIRIALGETVQAWKLGWQLFERAASFHAFQKLQKLHDELGQPEAEFLHKVEQQFANPRNQQQRDAQCEFYLSIGNANAAKQCATVGAISSPLLLKVADAIVSTEPTQSLSIYQQVISNMLGQSDNKIYRQVIDLLLHLQRQLQHHQHPLDIFEAAVGALAVEQRRKRNFIALIHKHFPSYF